MNRNLKESFLIIVSIISIFFIISFCMIKIADFDSKKHQKYINYCVHKYQNINEVKTCFELERYYK